MPTREQRRDIKEAYVAEYGGRLSPVDRSGDIVRWNLHRIGIRRRNEPAFIAPWAGTGAARMRAPLTGDQFRATFDDVLKGGR